MENSSRPWPRSSTPRRLMQSNTNKSTACNSPSSSSKETSFPPPPFSPNLSRSFPKLSSPARSDDKSTAPRRRSLGASKENSSHVTTPPRLSFSEFGVAARRQKITTPPAASAASSAWALSPGRSPSPRRKGSVGGEVIKVGEVLGLFRRRKAAGSPEREEAVHQLKILSVRLLQWRFANAHADKAMAGIKSIAENKLFYALLRLKELRKIVAAKQMLVQKRKQKLKLIQVLSHQVQLLNRWETHARQHIEDVSTLGHVLAATCISLPLLEGAKVNLVPMYQCLIDSMGMIGGIEANSVLLYAKAEMISSVLSELVQIIQLEIEGLQEVIALFKLIASLEMQEASLRANLIQAMQQGKGNTINSYLIQAMQQGKGNNINTLFASSDSAVAISQKVHNPGHLSNCF